MPVELSQRSAVRWPAAFDVTLVIDPESVADDETVGIVGIRLVNMGGSFIRWQPNLALLEPLTARAHE